jgi:hypothetical protein
MVDVLVGYGRVVGKGYAKSPTFGQAKSDLRGGFVSGFWGVVAASAPLSAGLGSVALCLAVRQPDREIGTIRPFWPLLAKASRPPWSLFFSRQVTPALCGLSTR